MHQETHSNFFWNFCKKTSAHRGSDSKNRGVHSKKTQEKLKENKDPRLRSPNPRSLVDPDPQAASEALD